MTHAPVRDPWAWRGQSPMNDLRRFAAWVRNGVPHSRTTLSDREPFAMHAERYGAAAQAILDSIVSLQAAEANDNAASEALAAAQAAKNEAAQGLARTQKASRDALRELIQAASAAGVTPSEPEPTPEPEPEPEPTPEPTEEPVLPPPDVEPVDPTEPEADPDIDPDALPETPPIMESSRRGRRSK